MNDVIKAVKNSSGILFHIQKISELRHKDKLTGYQAKLKYWGANHSKNQEPPSPDRWMTNIVEQIINDRSAKIINTAWESSLKHQIPKEDLPNVDDVINGLRESFKKYLKRL